MADPAEVLGFGRTPPNDYEARQSAQPGAASSGPAVMAVTAAGALVVGFLLVAGLSAGREEALSQFERKDELVALIVEGQERTDTLSDHLQELRGRVEVAQAEAAAGVPALQAEVEDFEAAAGLIELRGPGLRVTLRDGGSSCPSTPYACKIQDADVQMAVNALFEASAEAVAVNGERVVATTAIRSAGQTILVNLRVLASPYTLEAVGDPGALKEGLAETSFARDFEVWTRDYGLGLDVVEEDELELPRFTGTVGMAAQPAGGGAVVEQ